MGNQDRVFRRGGCRKAVKGVGDQSASGIVAISHVNVCFTALWPGNHAAYHFLTFSTWEGTKSVLESRVAVFRPAELDQFSLPLLPFSPRTLRGTSWFMLMSNRNVFVLGFRRDWAYHEHV